MKEYCRANLWILCSHQETERASKRMTDDAHASSVNVVACSTPREGSHGFAQLVLEQPKVARLWRSAPSERSARAI
jgi:hypothetical protein